MGGRGVDFKIGDIVISAHLYWRLKKISYRACLLSYCIYNDRKQPLKALLICTFIRPLLISESRKGYTLRLLLMCLEALEEGFSCFPGRAVLENLNIKSKFNHGFTNRHCLHSAILKTCKARDMQFFLQNVQNEIYSRFWGMFKCNMKFNREAC